jgi:hypothetical protein
VFVAKKRFYLVKRRNRRLEGKAIYYCRFRNPDGKLLPWKSTGSTSKTNAENWALDHLDDAVSVRATLTFKQYAVRWWMPDCQYLIRKAARGAPVAPKGGQIGRSARSRTRQRGGKPFLDLVFDILGGGKGGERSPKRQSDSNVSFRSETLNL